jgi:hypothetical protein
MGTNINAYDVLNRILQYKHLFRSHNPLTTFEYVLNFDQLSDLIDLLEQINVNFTYLDDSNGKKKGIAFNFLSVNVEINKNLPL